jgi:ABC-type xylose transport system permease subunit
VLNPLVTWGNLKRTRLARNTKWAFKAGAQEEALFRAAVFKSTTKKAQILKVLRRGQPKALLVARGTIKAKTRVVILPHRRLKPGRYLYAIGGNLKASTNQARTTLVVSRPFRVR